MFLLHNSTKEPHATQVFCLDKKRFSLSLNTSLVPLLNMRPAVLIENGLYIVVLKCTVSAKEYYFNLTVICSCYLMQCQHCANSWVRA